MERGLSRHGRLLVGTRHIRSDRRRLLMAVLCAPLFASLAGCAVWGRFFPHRQPPCALRPGASNSEIVARVNQNFTPPAGPPLGAWECTQVTMYAKNMPGYANADISVQAPHKFRVRAFMPLSGSEVADFGSNSDEVWFWSREGPGVVTASHEELPQFLNQMQIPFEPEWLMEVLGVMPIDPTQYEMVRPTPENGYVDLVADQTAPNGEPVRRLIRIDTCRGTVVEHRITSADGQVIARARLDKYEPDVTGRYLLPRFIQMEWPQANAAMEMHLHGLVHTDPEQLTSNWTVPQIRGYRQLRIGAPPSMEYSAETPTEILPIVNEQRELRSGERGARLTIPILSGDAPPAGYSAAASQSSSDQLLREQESGPQPFPALP